MKGGQHLGVSAFQVNTRKQGKQANESRTERKQYIISKIACRNTSDKCLKDVVLVRKFSNGERWS